MPHVPSDYHDQLREMARIEKEARGKEEPKEVPRPDLTLGDPVDLRYVDLTGLVDNLPCMCVLLFLKNVC